MPLILFKKQFAEKVRSGLTPGGIPGISRKRQSIRKPRKRPFKVSDILYIYTGPRMKPVKIGEGKVTKVTPIIINWLRKSVQIGENYLSKSGIKDLAWKDGFEDVEAFWQFFYDDIHFKGDLIEWDPNYSTNEELNW